ncbi:hypothetical protein HDV00_000363 [Rhizophlyctis rosea]|nr:hypothetical protein HDV00_000363 [Rhizophlyctis rosea]
MPIRWKGTGTWQNMRSHHKNAHPNFPKSTTKIQTIRPTVDDRNVPPAAEGSRKAKKRGLTETLVSAGKERLLSTDVESTTKMTKTMTGKVVPAQKKVESEGGEGYESALGDEDDEYESDEGPWREGEEDE